MGFALASFLRMSGAAGVALAGHQPRRLESIAVTLRAGCSSSTHARSRSRTGSEIGAVGATAIIREASRLLKPGGTAGVVGVIRNKDARLSLFELKNNTAVHMLNWPYREHATHGELIDLFVSGQLRPPDYCSHVMPLDEAPRAVQMIREREAFKVVLRM